MDKDKDIEKILKEIKKNKFLGKYHKIVNGETVEEQINLFMCVISIGLRHLSQTSNDSRYSRLYKKIEKYIKKIYYKQLVI